MWCPGPRGHCRCQGDVGAALVPCQAAGHGGGCRCILLSAAASHSSPAVPWGKWAEPCQGWMPRGCHFPSAPSPPFHLGPPHSGHTPLHQLLRGIQGLLALAQSLAESSSPREETLGEQTWKSGQGLAATESPQHEMPRARKGPRTLQEAQAPRGSPQPPSPFLTHLSAAVRLPGAEGCPAGQAESTCSQHLSCLDGQTDRNSLPLVSTFSQAPAPASSLWPPSVGFYT